MSILYNAAAHTITLNTRRSTYQMKVDYEGILLHTYYGPSAEGDLSYAIFLRDRGFCGNPYSAGRQRDISMAVLPQEFPCEGSGDYRPTAFTLKDENGVYGSDLRYVSHEILAQKPVTKGLPGVHSLGETAQTLRVTLRDVRLPVEVDLLYTVLPEEDAIIRRTVVRNTGAAPVYVENAASAALDFMSGDWELMHFYGSHSRERITERLPLSHVETVVGSRRGCSGHHQNPFVVLTEHDTTEDFGVCIGAGLLWSGSFNATALRDSFDQTRLLMGLQHERFSWQLCGGETFTSPECALILSDEGFTPMSHKFHALVHDHILRGPWADKVRPVLINNWEATYMNFDGEKLCAIASKAAELGVDMLVLDDGWFGNRCDDWRGLGDWWVNEEKLGCPLPELVKKIKAMGMKFGLWFEPEMINEDTALYKKHPDWALTIPGKDPVRSRFQLVLDYSRKEVVDGICEMVFNVLDGSGVDYVKMDMNRNLCDVYTRTEGWQNQGAIMYKYVLGVYDFMDRLLTRYPELLLEGCSGGGGRFDLGMLYYCPQIWCSDDTDAIERLGIQYGTSFAYPPSCMGAHVSACPNHQTGRTTPIATRAAVATAGTFGYELDLNLLSDAEKAEVVEQIKEYKRVAPLMRHGLYYRLTDVMHNREEAAWMFTDKDRTEALLTIVKIASHDNGPARYIRLKGLDAAATYRCAEDGREYTGSALMRVGILMPRLRGEYVSAMLHFSKM